MMLVNVIIDRIIFRLIGCVATLYCYFVFIGNVAIIGKTKLENSKQVFRSFLKVHSKLSDYR